MKKIISMVIALGALTACPGNFGTVFNPNDVVSPNDTNVVVNPNTTVSPVDANTQDANTQQQ